MHKHDKGQLSIITIIPQFMIQIPLWTHSQIPRVHNHNPSINISVHITSLCGIDPHPQIDNLLGLRPPCLTPRPMANSMTTGNICAMP